MISNKAKKELLRMRTAASFPYLLEIDHPTEGVFRYANTTDKQGILFEGNRYAAASFVITPPEMTSSGYSNAQLSLSCVDQEWIIKIRNHQNDQRRATARFVATIVMESDGNVTVEALDDLPFELTEVSWNEAVITWTMVFADPLDISIPVDVANIDNCPGCQ